MNPFDHWHWAWLLGLVVIAGALSAWYERRDQSRVTIAQDGPGGPFCVKMTVRGRTTYDFYSADIGIKQVTQRACDLLIARTRSGR